MAESRVGEATAVTAENLIDAGRIFVSINEYDLARSYFERAQKEGADQEMVNLGLANTEIALGNTRAATLLLKTVGNKDVTVRELPGLNHLFQTCKTGSPAEYGAIEETLAPVVLETIAEWIGKRTGSH